MEGRRMAVSRLLKWGWSAVAVCVLVAMYDVMDSSLGAQLLRGYGDITLTWTIMFAAGYLQWFWLCPWLWRKHGEQPTSLTLS